MCDFRTGLHACAGGGHLTHAGEGCEAFAGAARSIETKAMGFREGNKLIALIRFNAGRVSANFPEKFPKIPRTLSQFAFNPSNIDISWSIYKRRLDRTSGARMRRSFQKC